MFVGAIVDLYFKNRALSLGAFPGYPSRLIAGVILLSGFTGAVLIAWRELNNNVRSRGLFRFGCLVSFFSGTVVSSIAWIVVRGGVP